jgi:hypothetical protein
MLNSPSLLLQARRQHILSVRREEPDAAHVDRHSAARESILPESPGFDIKNAPASLRSEPLAPLSLPRLNLAGITRRREEPPSAPQVVDSPPSVRSDPQQNVATGSDGDQPIVALPLAHIGSRYAPATAERTPAWESHSAPVSDDAILRVNAGQAGWVTAAPVAAWEDADLMVNTAHDSVPLVDDPAERHSALLRRGRSTAAMFSALDADEERRLPSVFPSSRLPAVGTRTSGGTLVRRSRSRHGGLPSRRRRHEQQIFAAAGTGSGVPSDSWVIEDINAEEPPSAAAPVLSGRSDAYHIAESPLRVPPPGCVADPSSALFPLSPDRECSIPDSIPAALAEVSHLLQAKRIALARQEVQRLLQLRDAAISRLAVESASKKQILHPFSTP